MVCWVAYFEFVLYLVYRIVLSCDFKYQTWNHAYKSVWFSALWLYDYIFTLLISFLLLVLIYSKGLADSGNVSFNVFPIPKSTLENIFKKFMSVIIEDFNKIVPWNSTSKSFFSYWLIRSKLQVWKSYTLQEFCCRLNYATSVSWWCCSAVFSHRSSIIWYRLAWKIC